MPNIGDIVHVVHRHTYNKTLVIEPAVVTAVWGPDCVNLRVFCDNSDPPEHITSVIRIDNAGDWGKNACGYAWCWPTRK